MLSIVDVGNCEGNVTDDGLLDLVRLDGQWSTRGSTTDDSRLPFLHHPVLDCTVLDDTTPELCERAHEHGEKNPSGVRFLLSRVALREGSRIGYNF